MVVTVGLQAGEGRDQVCLRERVPHFGCKEVNSRVGLEVGRPVGQSWRPDRGGGIGAGGQQEPPGISLCVPPKSWGWGTQPVTFAVLMIVDFMKGKHLYIAQPFFRSIS